MIIYIKNLKSARLIGNASFAHAQDYLNSLSLAFCQCPRELNVKLDVKISAPPSALLISHQLFLP
jgi:hypothetical protein